MAPSGAQGREGDHTLSFRLILIGWSLPCFAGWLVLGGIAEKQEADCRAADGLFCFSSGSALLLVGLIAFGVWLVGALIAWGVSKIDATTTVVIVREGATVTKEGRVYRSGERLIVLSTDAERLRQSKLIE